MKKRKITELWTSLSAQETKDFVQSHLPGTGRFPSTISQLADCFTRLGPEGWQPEELWAKIHPDKPFQDKQLNKYLTRLTRSLEEYLVSRSVLHENITSHIQRELMFLEICLERSLEKTFIQKAKRIQKKYVNQDICAVDDIQNRMEFHRIMTKYHNQDVLRRAQARQEQRLYLQMLDALWAVEKIVTITSSNQPPSHDGELSLAGNILKTLPDSPLLSLISLLHNVYEGSVALETGWRTMLQGIHRIAAHDLNRLYSLIFNLTSRKIHLGESGPLDYMIEMNELITKTGLFDDSEQRSESVLQQQVIMLCRMGRISQAKKVVRDFIGDSDSQTLSATVKFCQGLIAYSEGNVRFMRRTWASMESPTDFQKNLADLLDCYSRYQAEYGQENWLSDGAPDLKSSLNNLKKRLESSTSLSPLLKVALLNRIRIFRMFLDDRPDWKLIQENISQTHPLNGRDWLMKQAIYRQAEH